MSRYRAESAMTSGWVFISRSNVSQEARPPSISAAQRTPLAISAV